MPRLAVMAESSEFSRERTDLTGRLELIDALRGAALFGVLLVNMIWFAGYENTLNSSQIDVLTDTVWNRWAGEAIELLVYAKAIGIFTFLFGVGFALQMRGLEGRGISDPERVYVRRLYGLLVLGLLHWLFLWSGEILHIYALGGLLLLVLARCGLRTLLVAGLILAVMGRPVVGRLLAVWTTGGAEGFVFDDQVLAERFDIFTNGSLVDVVTVQFWQDCLPQLTTGVMLAAIAHALGRFMIGAALARRGYLQNSSAYKTGYGVLLVVGVFLGYVAQRDWWFRDLLARHGWVTDKDWLILIGHILNSLGVTALTGAYIAAFVLAWHVELLQRVLRIFVPVGRIALTAYLMHTPICYWLFCGFGLGLMGRVGPAGCIGLSLALFGLQMIAAHWWLTRFRMGPVEWLWRWWTYGVRPRFRVA